MLDIFSVKNRRILVTGAANGNGLAIVKSLVTRGASVCALDVDKEALSKMRDDFELSGLGEQIDTVSLDLANDRQLTKFLSKENSYEVLINNAGVTRGNHLTNYKDEDWDLTYRVNLLAPFKIMRSVSTSMIANRKGSIINVTSLAAEQGFPENPAYVAFKGALKQLTQAAALDLAASNIRVNSIGPGYFRTNMTKVSWSDTELKNKRTARIPMGRWGEPDDLAGLVIFLASDASKYITGQSIYVDGGWLSKGL